MHALLDQLFPFHVRMDAAGVITACGRSSEKVLGSVQGRPFLEVFAGIRPALCGHDHVRDAIGDIVLLQLIGRPLQMRGQFVELDDGGVAFVGSPRVVDVASVEAWPVGLQDFAPHDASADYGMVLEAMQVQLKDLERIVDRLQDAELAERALRERAESANLAKTNFLANISHEIRTPMTAVLGYAELLLDADLPESERLDAAQTIVRNGKHLMSILNDVLDLSKIEAGRMELTKREFSLTTLLREVRSLMDVNAIARGNSLALRVDIAAGHDEVMSDPVRIRQVLLNLVGNAVKFTQHGAITIEAATAHMGDSVALRVAVRDTGSGIAKEQFAKLFEPFSQLDSDFIRAHGGSGLGLAISHKIAAMLGGRIEVQSTPGVGSTFTLHALMERAGGARSGEPVRAPECAQPLAGKRILLVEDCDDSVRLLTAMLERAGAQVVVCADGACAESRAMETPASDVILMDVQLPKESGLVAVGRIRAQGCRARIVALTAAAVGVGRADAIAAGCDEYALKPITRSELVRVCLGPLASLPPSV